MCVCVAPFFLTLFLGLRPMPQLTGRSLKNGTKKLLEIPVPVEKNRINNSQKRTVFDCKSSLNPSKVPKQNHHKTARKENPRANENKKYRTIRANMRQ